MGKNLSTALERSGGDSLDGLDFKLQVKLI